MFAQKTEKGNILEQPLLLVAFRAFSRYAMRVTPPDESRVYGAAGRKPEFKTTGGSFTSVTLLLLTS